MVLFVLGIIAVGPALYLGGAFDPYFQRATERAQRATERADAVRRYDEAVATARTEQLQTEARETAIATAAKQFPQHKADILNRLTTLEQAVRAGDWSTAWKMKVRVEADLRPLLPSAIASGPEVLEIRSKFEKAATAVLNSAPAPFPAAAPAESTESLLTVPAGKFTPAQIEMARHDIEFTKSITNWEESSTGAYITFRHGNYNPDPIQIYRRAERIVIGDQASTGKIRYLTFYDPTNKKVASFSPAFGLKMVE